MAINVRVVSNLGELRGEAGGVEVNSLCQRACAADMPGLGHVDEYDDTYFNHSQMRLLVPELERLGDSVAPHEAEMVQQLLNLAQMVRTHDQMIFVGD